MWLVQSEQGESRGGEDQGVMGSDGAGTPGQGILDFLLMR